MTAAISRVIGAAQIHRHPSAARDLPDAGFELCVEQIPRFARHDP